MMSILFRVPLQRVASALVLILLQMPEFQPAWMTCIAEENQPSPVKPGATRLKWEDVIARPVTVNSRGIPLKEVLEDVARSARVPLKLDEPALAVAKFDLDAPVTLAVTSGRLGDVLAKLIDFQRGVFWELRRGEVFITTWKARNARVVEVLPAWLKSIYGHGLLVVLDDDDQVASVTTGNIMTDELLAQLKTLPKLRELTVGSSKRVTAAGLVHLAAMPRLERLSLSSMDSTNEELGDVVLQQIAGLQSLKSLHMEECGVTDAGIHFLERMPQLTHLCLQDGRITDGAIASIARLQQLKSLELPLSQSEKYGRMEFSAVALRQLSALQNLEVLRLTSQSCDGQFLPLALLTTLDISGPLLDDVAAERISQCRELKSLSVSRTRMTDDGWKMICTLPELRGLHIHREQITDDGIAHLKRLKKLEHLELRTPSLTDAAIGHVAEIASLTRLDLWSDTGALARGGGGAFTVAGLEQLKQLPNLRTLWLYDLSDPAGYIGLRELTQLRELVFEMSGISQEQYNELETVLPNTRISAGTGAGFRESIHRPKIAPAKAR